MNGFLTDDFNRTGRAGKIIDIGKGKEPGASRAINLDRNSRDRNYDIKGKSNINRGLRFSDISNRDKSNKDKGNPRFGNLRNSSALNNWILNLGASDAKENLNANKDKGNPRFGNLRNSSTPNNWILNLGASDAKENLNAKSLKENRNEGMQNIESRITRSLKMLPSIISARIAFLSDTISQPSSLLIWASCRA